MWPVKTNAGFLARALADPDFHAGEIDTAFIPGKLDTLVPDPEPSDAVWNLAAMATLSSGSAEGEGPWAALAGFRLGGPSRSSVTLSHGRVTRTIDTGAELALEGVATAEAGNVLVFSDGQAFAFSLPGSPGASGGGDALDGDLVSPMPGRVISLDALPGQAVTRGDRLVTLEAMKMEHSLVAPFDGIVTSVMVSEGAQVSEATLLVRIEKVEKDA